MDRSSKQQEKIIILMDSSQLGGIESHVYHLARALHSSGWEAEIWFYCRYDDCHPLPPRLDHEKLPYRFLDGSFRSLYRTLEQASPLLLHTHGYKGGLLGRICAKTLNIPVVSTFHNGDPGEGIVRLYTFLDRLTSRYSLNIAVSEEIARRFRQPPKCINNFIDIPELLDRHGKAIAFAGRLSHEKGPDLFLQLAKHQPHTKFRIYGTGPMEQDLTGQNPGNVRFMGQVSGMNDQWHKIDLLCITSRHEGLPMVALEAMANGVPVISFELGALPQLIEQGVNGWITPKGDIQSMSSLIELWQSLPDSVQEQIRKSCINTITKDYSYKAVLPQVLEVYRKACREKGLLWPASKYRATKRSMSLTGD